jgi:hypothetical protein
MATANSKVAASSVAAVVSVAIGMHSSAIVASINIDYVSRHDVICCSFVWYP